MQITEPWYFHLPATIVFQFFISFSQITFFYGKANIENHVEFVYENKMGKIILMVISQLFISYSCSLTSIYLINKNDMILKQLNVAKQTLKVVVNHLNQALFLRNDDG